MDSLARSLREGPCGSGESTFGEKIADVNKARNDGVTPLSIASKMGHVEVVSILIENGA